MHSPIAVSRIVCCWRWEGGYTVVSDDFNWSLNVALPYKQLWQIPNHEYSLGALSALRNLSGRIQSELDACRAHALNMHDIERQAAVEWLAEWLDNEGRSIVNQIESMIASGDSQDRVLMERAIRAAENLAVTSCKQELRTADDWYEAFDWVKEILPALCRSFKEYSVECVSRTIDYTDSILEQAQYTPDFDAVPLSDAPGDVWRCFSSHKDIQSRSFAA